MSKDILTRYTKTKNIEDGRRGYGMWKYEKESIISPRDYGMFLQRKNNKNRR